jgi:DNA invertase Pin-like site-specific DNA recombinase
MIIPLYPPSAFFVEGPIPVFAYLRMCTKDQASFRNQLESIRAYAASHGMVVVRVFADEGHSQRGIKG